MYFDVKCGKCNGSGKVRRWILSTTACPRCAGKGTVSKKIPYAASATRAQSAPVRIVADDVDLSGTNLLMAAAIVSATDDASAPQAAPFVGGGGDNAGAGATSTWTPQVETAPAPAAAAPAYEPSTPSYSSPDAGGGGGGGGAD